MKRILFFTFLCSIGTLGINRLYAQKTEESPKRLFRIYEDNDFVNIRGKGTDRAYTNGTRLDFFYTKKRKPRFVIDQVMPKAGEHSIDIYGWGITQLMFTPVNISTIAYQRNDYPYAGALMGTRSLYSYNPERNYSFQTELQFGVRGPAAFAEQTQKFLHRLIGYQKPMGWDNQLKNKLLVNVNVTFEKQMLIYNNWFELIGGGQALAGSVVTAAGVYPLIRIGKFNRYFNGFINQRVGSKVAGSKSRNRIQAYLIMKPQAIAVFSNSLLSGNINASHPEIKEKAESPRRIVGSFNLGALVAINHISLSFNQAINTPVLDGVYAQEVGNISLHYSW